MLQNESDPQAQEEGCLLASTLGILPTQDPPPGMLAQTQDLCSAPPYSKAASLVHSVLRESKSSSV